MAESLSSRLNTAYEALRSPLSRIEYILKIHGLELQETDHFHDAEFISNIMESREELEEADDPERVDDIEKEYQGRLVEMSMLSWIVDASLQIKRIVVHEK